MRHPSFLGAVLGAVGWVLVFRSGPGLLLILLFIPMPHARMNAEEALLLAEFGEEYVAYRSHTWRMVSLIY